MLRSITDNSLFINGKVFDEAQNPLEGVNIFVASTQVYGQPGIFVNGATTNANGSYTLPFPVQPSEKITFSYQGNISILTASQIKQYDGNVFLQTQESLDEITVTAPGKTKFNWPLTIGITAGIFTLGWLFSNLSTENKTT